MKRSWTTLLCSRFSLIGESAKSSNASSSIASGKAWIDASAFDRWGTVFKAEYEGNEETKFSPAPVTEYP